MHTSELYTEDFNKQTCKNQLHSNFMCMVLSVQANTAEPDHAMLYMSVPDRKPVQKH